MQLEVTLFDVKFHVIFYPNQLNDLSGLMQSHIKILFVNLSEFNLDALLQFVNKISRVKREALHV